MRLLWQPMTIFSDGYQPQVRRAYAEVSENVQSQLWKESKVKIGRSGYEGPAIASSPPRLKVSVEATSKIRQACEKSETGLRRSSSQLY